MKWMILGQIKDLQTGIYIVNTVEEMGDECAYVDIRQLSEIHGINNAQKIILEKIDELDYTPDVIIVLKGLEMTLKTLQGVRDKFPKAILTNWFFDVKLAGVDIWDNDKFYPALKLYDYFFCSLGGVAEKLKESGFENVHHVGEGCYPPLHGEQYMNSFQEKKYGEDIAFIGTIGLNFAHKNRIQYLQKIVKEGFNIKIWGGIAGEAKSIPLDIRHSMTGDSVVNERHSMVCQSTLVNLGIDQDPTLNASWSARLYRIMCSGGLYLSTPTKGLENYFKINKRDEPITEDQDLVVFYNEADLIEKIDFLLENEEIRKKIAENGKKKVLAEHTFKDRINDIMKIVGV